jgi:DNA-directed RNA polymerase subunit RPC12/RpoP
MQTTSTITCPHCGNKSTETMAADACQFFYICNECKTQLRPPWGLLCLLFICRYTLST